MSGFTNENLVQLRQRFKLMDEGAAGSGVELRADLQTEIGEQRPAFAALTLTLDNQRAQVAQERRLAQAVKADALELLGKVAGDLTSNADQEQADYILDLYDLDNVKTKDRYKVLAHCQHVATVSAAETESQNQVAQPLLQELQTTAEALAGHLDKIQQFRADVAETCTAVRNAIVAGRYLRKRVHGHLISVLPLGKRDPKLMDFGFKLRSRRRSSSSVTVVGENETSEPVVVDETPTPA